MHPSATNEGTQQRLWTLTALCVVLGMQVYRVLLPGFRFYLQDSVGFSSLSLAPIALAVFSLGLAAYPLHRWLGSRRTLALAAIGLAVLRLALQISRDPAVNLIFSALGVTLFVVYLIEAACLAQRGRGAESLVLGLLLGVSADTALLTAAGTLDLVWRSGALAWVGVAALVLATLLLASLAVQSRTVRTIPGRAPPGSWRLLFIGPWFFLQMLMFQNVARLAAISGWDLPWAGLWVWAVNTVGILAALAVARGWMRSRLMVAAGGILFVLAAVPNATTGLAGVAATTLGHVLSFELLAILLTGSRGQSARPGPGRRTLSMVLGQELLVVLVFVYYASQDLALGFRAPAVPPVAAAILAIGAVAAARPEAGGRPRSFASAPVGLAVALVVFPLVLVLGWREPAVADGFNPSETRVMTYNVHQGFNTDGWLDIEGQAQVILESEADVIVLQEMARGYVIDGSLDMVSWLSQRLGMTYIWGPTADPLWGNAILSRLPPDRLDLGALPPADLLVRRGYIDAEYIFGANRLRLIATHLHHRAQDSAERVQQVEALLAVWNDGSRTVILGDMNALPGSPEMQLLNGAGLSDVLAETDPPDAYTFYAEDPSRQIDYIWLTPDLDTGVPAVIQTTASDHLPIVVDIR